MAVASVCTGFRHLQDIKPSERKSRQVLISDAHPTGVHEWCREVDCLLAERVDSQVDDSHVSFLERSKHIYISMKTLRLGHGYLVYQLPNGAGPLAVNDVAVSAIADKVELVLELQLLGEIFHQVDAETLVLLLERHPLEGLLWHIQLLLNDEGGVLCDESKLNGDAKGMTQL